MQKYSTITCKNCNHKFEGNYCNNCGQTAETHEINFNSIIHEIQHGVFHVDKGILYTTKELLTRPGYTISDYLNGKRVKHFKPFGYVFILSATYAVLTEISGKSNMFSDFLIGWNDSASENPNDKSSFLLVDVIQWMVNHYAYAVLFLIPIISLASYLCFFRTKFNYFQHLILNSYIVGQRTAVYLVLLPFTYPITNQNLSDGIDWIKIVIGILLTCWSYYQFFSSIKTTKRILLIFLTYLVLPVLVVISIFLIAATSKLIH